MDVGLRIRRLRENKGWTTNRLANQCGLSQSFLRSVELGEKGISVENLALICDALQVSLGDFFADADRTATPPDPLTEELQRLTPRQRQALAVFLQAIRD